MLRPLLLQAALEAEPFAISTSFGAPAPYAARIRAAGVKLICQVRDRESALRAEAAGADLLVAQGTEAGGHTGGVGTLPLLQVVLECVTAPVVAAGGIASGRGLAAVLAAQDFGTAQLYAGQTVGLLERVEPAAEIVRRIATDAEQRLGALTSVLSRAILPQ